MKEQDSLLIIIFSLRNKMEVPIYCVKCRDKTASIDPQVLVTKSGRYRRAAKCTECGGKKSVFIKMPVGGKGLVPRDAEPANDDEISELVDKVQGKGLMDDIGAIMKIVRGKGDTSSEKLGKKIAKARRA